MNAVSLFRKSEAGYLTQLETLFHSQRFSQALDLANKAVAEYPNNPDFYLAICDAFMFLGDVAKAYAALKKGLSIDKNRPNLRVRQLQLLYLWNIKFNTDNPEDAYETAKIGCYIADVTMEMELPKELQEIANAATAHLYNQRSDLAAILGKEKTEVWRCKRAAVLCFREAVRSNPSDEDLKRIYLGCLDQYNSMENPL